MATAPKKLRRKPVKVRSPERTRQRILDAALVEFAAQGFAGARVDRIARRSGGNKRMLYHYFGDKKRLLQAALHQKIAQRVIIADSYPEEPGERIAAWFLATCADAEWVRLLGWEALQNSGDNPVDEKSRRKIAQAAITKIRRQQKAGEFSASVEATYAFLAMMSLAIFPQAFPQLTRLVCGKPVCDAKFQRDYATFLKQIAASFRPVTARR